ncbi:MAG: peptidyl-prolyl cis-trans isomerase, partial [Myxococcota bacterium]
DDARRSRVFAKVGDAKITVGDLEDLINQRSPYARKRFEDPEMVRGLADDRVRAELLFLGAKKLGYANDPQVVAFLDRTILQTFMQEEIEQAVGPESISDADLRRYFDEHPEDFRRPEMRRASHILVGSREEAIEIIKELAGGANKTFGAMAKQRSLDTETRLRGGDLLYFTEDGVTVGAKEDARVDPALAKTAYRLSEKGEIVKKPVRLADDQWSVVRLTSIRPEQVETFEDAKSGIRRRLWREGRKAAVEAIVVEVRTELQPEQYPERMDSIVLDRPEGAVEPANQ